ncbi:MAG TPA: hypothetical protein VLN48_17465 [Bryobacteraceae bacterium]|nr:hypothetical protein [Bryobacteraceae bacterium]
MQCLFCGKELALLKRLRGGAEFCSEAHRKEYQEQYEQLALARLIQAKPPTEAASPLGRTSKLLPTAPLSVDVRAPESKQAAQAPPAPRAPQIQAPPPRPMIEAPTVAHNAKPPQDGGPAPLAGFVGEMVVPAIASFQHAGPMELDRRTAPPPSLPGAGASDPQSCLPPAASVEWEVSLQALDYNTRRNDRGVEPREFAGTAPVFDLHAEIPSEPGSEPEPADAADVMEIAMSPHPPQSAAPWLGPPRGFPAAPAELGHLARLDFNTMGFAYSDRPASASSSAPQASVLLEEPPPSVEPPRTVEPPQIAEPVPELVTQALPVTLHGLAAARGKFTPTFTSAMAAPCDIQIPPSAVLPLRPAIVFGPAPAPPAPAAPAPVPEVNAAPVQPAPAQPKPEQPRPEAKGKTSVVPAPKPVSIKRPAAPEAPAPKVAARIAPAEPRPEPRPAVEPRTASPESQQVRASSASDSDMPSLRMEATESAWSKLSVGVKIGVAAALVAVLSGIGYVVTRGNGKPANEAPAVTQAPAAVATGVPISGGWIEDWAGVAKSNRRISVLSGSQKLSDYRMEFQAQIESKAVGWVFRGLNPRNYYVAKLEVVKAGLEPAVALVHFAVVDGKDENRVAVPLPMKLRVDTTYKIRFEAMGTHFSAWVQGQKIDEWTDNRFGSGGVGLFSERDEHAALQGIVNVVPLVSRN